MQRVFSSLTVKMIDEDQRIIEGIASTPRADRVGDIVDSLGASYDLPIPFLLDHNHTEAVGDVEFAEVTATGIRFRARIRKIAEPGAAKDLVDRAWSLVKNGLRRFVSIGFRPLEYEPLRDGGTRYLSWEWLELSAVSVAAQPDARITGIKAHAGNRVVRLQEHPVSSRVVRLSEVDKRKGKIIADARKRIDRHARLGIRAPRRVKL